MALKLPKLVRIQSGSQGFRRPFNEVEWPFLFGGEANLFAGADK
jgi:hypothetical protein